MAYKACVLLANGCEEVETITPIDYLRRAGIETVVAGIDELDIIGSHNVKLTADIAIDELEGDFDCIVVPGGKGGSQNIAKDLIATSLVKRHFEQGKLVAAICAAPVIVLDRACGILGRYSYTCFPGLEKEASGGKFLEERVVVDRNLITARAAGCAGEFAYAIVRNLLGKEAADTLANAVLL